MDKICIRELEVFAHHGVFPKEQEEGQSFYISCELDLDLEQAGKSDDLADTVNYGEICHLIKKTMEEETNRLIERCAQRIAEKLLLFDQRIRKVWLEIRKPSAPIGLPLAYPSVQVERSWHQVYIGLGSNLGDSQKRIREALETLDRIEEIRVERVSDLAVTRPYGFTDQPDFLNGVAALKTILSPGKLLETLQRVELEAGRERTIHWGPRTLDLDILFYDDLVLEEEKLCLPHPDMKNRSFVLRPLAQIAPWKVHPVYHLRVKELLEELEEKEKRF